MCTSYAKRVEVKIIIAVKYDQTKMVLIDLMHIIVDKINQRLYMFTEYNESSHSSSTLPQQDQPQIGIMTTDIEDI